MENQYSTGGSGIGTVDFDVHLSSCSLGSPDSNEASKSSGLFAGGPEILPVPGRILEGPVVF